MTTIAVISDTHGSEAAITACIEKAGSVDGFFHLGDMVSDAKLIAKRTGKPVYSVLGNCDSWGFSDEQQDIFPEPQKAAASERIVTVEGVKLFLCHGHAYNVDFGTERLGREAFDRGCAAALYGHTHVPELSAYGKVLKLNPGSPARSRYGSKPSFAILEIDGRNVDARMILLKG